ncbi:MAG: putative pre6S rRNA nuclease [Patescibacteria group bacterium]|jgi:putative Holliday junction resolvase|nr:putative pre6S rRNA nuclease [Patescibacteria group bacterium]
MRYLGIDFGSKRVGVAISDETNSFAFPLKVIENSTDIVEDIVVLCKENRVSEVVVGESRDFSQKNNKIMEEIIPFVEKLKEKIGLPVRMHPEFLTSQEAERLQGKNEMHDASAAALILKSFLDLKNNKN